ncbi:MAG: Asp-tRNA(Asn)/Glu-tRNA(Gln) amidotransferase subunit GatA [Fusobacterium perfoetens]|uniref:Asp-tRNA(Asn)/Glu-tRNA(Gln) amidotransferase subunit GatA n=1 Tax=Fusobacterium perfoetens TaxID=852 RepID=UPI0023EFB1CD|nr:Asp-tRNA(Asn)/Glu-tRNA(Gln) amidotransferase subunit GatA [Fusobacterium perfoetens]MCI6153259.1 Asp-tRNA(Asn)/Glu-tRNA(Gln) amidotransferase subunit GatA [Fusobacterium perfoetens]MDY3238360.1 Asp-tRNA(Asn)/Glu-tRNA(Gln) amidotransferase subunit GatA [Fusobacterium perfoetens]
MKEIYELTASEVRNKILNKELTSFEVVNAIFDRIEKTDELIGSFVSLRKEKALEEAKLVDEKIARGEKVGYLAGVPVAIKDNMVSLNDPATSCSKILEGYEGIYDATVVTKLKEADAIIIGKTNMDEFAMGGSTKTSCYKLTKNPWDLSKVPGGSSGGAASSVAAQQCFISLGSDTGGSIRQPASFCGVVGLKPTYGRVSRYGLMAFASSLDQIGPLAKNVEDIALAMNVIAGYDDYDATVSKLEVPDYTEFLGKDIKGIKIGVPKEYFVDGMNEDIKRVMFEALDKLKELGAEIVDISLPHTKYALPTYYVLAPAEASANLARFDGIRYGYRSKNAKDINDLYVKSRSEGFGSEVKRRIMIGTYVLSAGFYDAYFKKAQKVRALIKSDFDKAFESVDMIFTPVAPSTAFSLDAVKTPLELYLEDIFTLSANLAGVPGLSIPAGLSNGLPVGMQLLGKYFEEGKLLSVGSAFEKIRGEWKLPEGVEK